MRSSPSRWRPRSSPPSAPPRSRLPWGASGAALVEPVAVTAELPPRVSSRSRRARSDRPDLQTASRVVSGGRALRQRRQPKILYSLADARRAAVGAFARAAVDAGLRAERPAGRPDRQIIARAVSPPSGISGAIQHLTGIKDARTIVAVNKGRRGPIFEIADIGLVGDLFQVVPEIEAPGRRRQVGAAILR